MLVQCKIFTYSTLHFQTNLKADIEDAIHAVANFRYCMCYKDVIQPRNGYCLNTAIREEA